MINLKHPAGEIRDTLQRILVARWRKIVVHLWKKSVVFKGIEAG
jgi:hypothetical protein